MIIHKTALTLKQMKADRLRLEAIESLRQKLIDRYIKFRTTEKFSEKLDFQEVISFLGPPPSGWTTFASESIQKKFRREVERLQGVGGL